MSINLPEFTAPEEQSALEAQPKAMAIKSKNGGLYIGIPKEITFQENRVALTPSSVSYLTANGHRVVVESDAGKASHFTDQHYSEAGAEIATTKEEVYKSNIILKIDPPTSKEVDLMHPGQLIISALQLDQLDELLLRKLMDKRVNALAYEFLEDDSGALPIIRAMSEMAGTASIMIAAELLTNSQVGKGELLGGFAGIPPTQVVIIGAGAVGEYAARTALALGANVKVFDNNVYRLRRLQNLLGRSIYTSTIHPNVLSHALSASDVVIGALRGKSGRSPVVVTEQMVMQMRPRSVMIDVSIDRGGNFETSEVTNHEKPIYRRHEVIHYCVPNIASRVSRTASYALSNIFTPLLMDMAETGGFHEYLRFRAGARKGTYLLKGLLTNKTLAEHYNMRYQDINLLIGMFS
jgi:alanine dehydrogenase